MVTIFLTSPTKVGCLTETETIPAKKVNDLQVSERDRRRERNKRIRI